MRVILIDDSKSVLAAIQTSLLGLVDIHVEAFLDPVLALEACKSTPFDLVLVDYTMPRMNGVEVIRQLRANPSYQHVPIIMVTSETERSIRIEAIEAGATEFLRKPFDGVELRARVANLLTLRQAQLDLADQAKGLERLVNSATAKLAVREEEIIWRLARAIEYRDGSTGEHVSRVAHICRLIAEALGFDHTYCRMIYLAAPLHDVGKIGIADNILSKPGRLTEAEIAEMRQHVQIGVRILENGSSDLVRTAEKIAGGHHEKWDGSGYPNGLVGEAIPIEARIVAVADVFEALCSERSYKSAWAPQQALEYLRTESGKHFDPACIAAFERQWPAIEALMTGSDDLVEARSAKTVHLSPEKPDEHPGEYLDKTTATHRA
ncbi:response regulator receiver modulated metal dependent phosphohydrolase [Rhizobium sp. PDO1-076]|uniref:HD-GYP domain-containing protein n=1 Tax=Rhizobium sp. PDO1-076 TaxID=1125979 RepID=UPI00024E2EF6|nr:HD domain-containing phosphohydrolase [Rhizobium sp. PDO1-076]EHS51668.1 response regulator receiver modulated metal dependent phosphohydrolase [Rhizobium sp. PDO1-076]